MFNKKDIAECLRRQAAVEAVRLGSHKNHPAVAVLLDYITGLEETTKALVTRGMDREAFLEAELKELRGLTISMITGMSESRRSNRTTNPPDPAHRPGR